MLLLNDKENYLEEVFYLFFLLCFKYMYEIKCNDVIVNCKKLMNKL